VSTQDVRAVALRAALIQGVPFVHKSGRRVTLVLSARALPTTDGRGRKLLRGSVQTIECPSAGLAAEVQRRVLTDLRAFPDCGPRILRVSLEYAESALRVARRRAGRA
jgi:hypothetical protein